VKSTKKLLAYFLFFLAKIIASTPAKPLSLRILSFLKANGTLIPNVDLTRAKIRIAQGRKEEAIEMIKEEVRLFPKNSKATQFLKRQNKYIKFKSHKKSRELSEIFSVISPYTMLSIARLEALLNGAKQVCNENIPGHFVECGVAGGGSSALLAWAIKKFSRQPRVLFCFDTFCGMPKPGKEDTHKGIPAYATGWGQGTCAAPVESLLEISEKLDVRSIVKPVIGLFQKTLPVFKNEIGNISLLHLDGDWYDSTKTILNNLYESASPNAYMQVDDYGHWEGCKKAIDEILLKKINNLKINPIDSTGICFRKRN
jgi:hypothetical protein